MNIIIVGCGKVGAAITQQLSLEGHDIAVIDTNADAIRNITEDYDVMGFVGNGASYGILKEAGIESADLFIAATQSDEVNLLSCLIAKKAGDCNTIARVRNPIYNQEIDFIREELGLSMAINPEFASAVEISRILRFPSAIKIETFVKGRVELLNFQLKKGSFLAGKTLVEVSKSIRTDVLVCAVERGEEVVIPGGSFKLMEGDMISIIATPHNAKSFFEKIGIDTHQVTNTMIAGGGTIAYYLAKILLDMGIHVKIIEKDKERCEMLSEQLPEAVIINGDAANQEVLIEEGLQNTESFVSMTGIDEGNVFLSLFAKSKSDAKIVTKLNRITFNDILNELDLGSIIYPKFVTAEYIIAYVRAKHNSMGSNVETMYRLLGDRVEALEFYISKESDITNVPLEKLKTKDNLLIACINHNGVISIANGKTCIRTGDTVIVVTTIKGLRDIKDVLAD